MLNTIFPPWPSFSSEEINAVGSVLKSNQVNYWTGTLGKQFESKFSDWCKTSKAIAVANGTVALDLAWIALKIKKGDEVIVTSRTYIASVSSIILAGGTPVFADVDLNSQNISAKTVEPLITNKTRAICCVHLAGWPCEMNGLRELAEIHKIAIVEDCAQAHGATYHGDSVGGIGDIGAWSFCQDKIMSTGGEGGMVTTNNENYWNDMWSYKDHGKSYAAVHSKKHSPGFRWIHESLGTNWRLTEMQSVLGLIQLDRMEQWSAERRKNAAQILDCAELVPGLRAPRPPEYITHAYYKCYVFVKQNELKAGWNRDRIMSKLVELNIPCYSGSCSEVYLEASFHNQTYKPAARLKNALTLSEESLMFLVHPTLTSENITQTCNALKQVMNLAVLPKRTTIEKAHA
jgi:dTDP-4-amino-4,6-dideoxygalactose transaminase